MPRAKKLDTQIIGNAGLYHTCYHLSLLGWNVMPTARNARGVDIIAYSADAKRFIGVQVKTLSKRNPVPLGSSIDKIMGDYWVIVSNVVTEPTSFVLVPKEVRKLANRGKWGGRTAYWLRPTQYDQDRYRDAWDRIGRGDARRS